jgi:hypothetical protein
MPLFTLFLHIFPLYAILFAFSMLLSMPLFDTISRHALPFFDFSLLFRHFRFHYYYAYFSLFFFFPTPQTPRVADDARWQQRHAAPRRDRPITPLFFTRDDCHF